MELHTSVSPRANSRREAETEGWHDRFDTLRAAAHALSDRTHRAHAPALAGLLQNRADDMEGNIAIWQRTEQDILALVEEHYGVYLTVATAVLFDPRYLNSAAPSPQAN